MLRKLLIAEDNIFTATQYKKFLEKNGYTVTLCHDGTSCLDKFNKELKYKKVVLKEDSSPFDFVLLDHDMPKTTGAEVAEKIHKVCPKQKIYFLSAYGQKIIQSCGIPKDGSLQILQKPFSLEFLLKKLEPKIFSIINRESKNNLFTATQSPETIR